MQMKKVHTRGVLGANAILIAAAILIMASPTPAQQLQPDVSRPWLDSTLPAETRATLALQAMTLDEKITLLHGHVGFPYNDKPKPDGAIGSAGYVEGIPRLGIPALQESDAGLGVANPHNVRPGDEATPLPSGLAIAATFDPALAERSGAMIGAEARAKGFNVLLAGGANIARDPRNGRNFEYASEDPLLTGVMVGAAIRGIQSNRIISTSKHYALNSQETARTMLSANIDAAAMRETDLLAFEIAIEQGHPHAVMCAYNGVNGTYSCENDFLLNQVLKQDWGYPGFVMSDWGALHSTEKAAFAGLDQESGEEMDSQIRFGSALKKAVEVGDVSRERLDDMVRRVLRAMFASGIVDFPPTPGGFIDHNLHAEIAQSVAERGMVLLRNDGVLPLRKGPQRIAVIGSHADKGVLSGGGSSQVIPVGGIALPGLGPADFPGPLVYDPSPPLKAIEAAAGGAHVEYAGGDDISRAVRIAGEADVAIVFAHQWMAEMQDATDLSLPDGQDQLIAAIAAANRRTVVVLETGGPVRMPWLSLTGAVIEAWYPGARGGEAIARILFGEVNPSGRLPITFPVDESQLPRPKIAASAATAGSNRRDTSEPTVELDYFEGAHVGYKWFDKNGIKPLYPFGFGLSYSSFAYAGLSAAISGSTIELSLDVKNVSSRRGADIPQFYLRCPRDTNFPMRLIGWSHVLLEPGETRRVMLTVDPRLLAHFDVAAHDWEITPARCIVEAGSNALDLPLKTEVTLGALRLNP